MILCVCVCAPGHKQKKMEAMIPCDTTYPGFTLEVSVREANSVIKCGRCQKWDSLCLSHTHTHTHPTGVAWLMLAAVTVLQDVCGATDSRQ